MFAKKVSKKEEKVKFNFGFLLRELAFFGVVVGVGLIAGYEIFRRGMAPDLEEYSYSVFDFLLGFAIALVAMILFLRFFKKSTVFKVFFAVLVFAGSEVFFSIWLPEIAAVELAALVTVWRFMSPTVLSQNVAISLAIIGIGAAFGIALDIVTVLIILTIFSVYDIVAVFKTRHMQRMFIQLFTRGAVFSILIPVKFGTWLAKIEKIGVGRKHGVLVLGTGDLVFPIMFAVAALRLSVPIAVGTFVGSLFGIIILHLLFLYAKRPIALPALPPIFAGSFFGFLIMYLVG